MWPKSIEANSAICCLSIFLLRKGYRMAKSMKIIGMWMCLLSFYAAFVQLNAIDFYAVWLQSYQKGDTQNRGEGWVTNAMVPLWPRVPLMLRIAIHDSLGPKCSPDVVHRHAVRIKYGWSQPWQSYNYLGPLGEGKVLIIKEPPRTPRFK